VTSRQRTGKSLIVFYSGMVSSHAFPTGFARGNAAAEFGTPPDHGVVFVDPVDEARRNNRLTECNAKCRYLKKMTC
jgi:hypothetical protein